MYFHCPSALLVIKRATDYYYLYLTRDKILQEETSEKEVDFYEFEWYSNACH